MYQKTNLIVFRVVKQKCPDIYALQEGCNLLNDKGTIGFIVPMTLSWSRKYQSLRDYLTSNLNLLCTHFQKIHQHYLMVLKEKLRQETRYLFATIMEPDFTLQIIIYGEMNTEQCYLKLQHYKAKGDLDGVWQTR